MTKNQKIATAGLVGTVIAVGACWFSVLSSEVALFERFPEIDPKIVVKAHRKMLRRILTGRSADFDANNDAECDRVFLEIVEELLAK